MKWPSEGMHIEGCRAAERPSKGLQIEGCLAAERPSAGLRNEGLRISERPNAGLQIKGCCQAADIPKGSAALRVEGAERPSEGWQR